MMLGSLQKNLMTLLSSIDDCRERRQILPCLILLYSGIDIVASLEKEKDEKTASAFKRWVNDYILPEKDLGCSANDLYGARCGIVHTFSPTSNYSRDGKAKEVYYAWGNAVSEKLQALISVTGKDYIVLRVDEFISVFKSAVIVYLTEIYNSYARLERVTKNAGVWFTDLEKTKLDYFINIIYQMPDT